MLIKVWWKVITLNDKQTILIDYIKNGIGQREIHRRTGVARDTIRKYVREYEDALRELGEDISEIQKVDLIEELTKRPKYKSTPRKKRAITDEVIERIKYFLKENENKRLTGFSKQQMKKIDIYEAFKEEGFDLSYSSVISAINKIEKTRKEAYIKQEYIPGEIVEFDFGTVKLKDDFGMIREYQLAVFTSAYSNFRWARLFPKQNTACFLEAHALFFNELKGNFRTIVYDNTRVAVKRFIGRSDKEPTDTLLKLSLYYKFDYRFCNAYSGNEKGHVERSVELIRRKAFSKNINFTNIDAANKHLIDILKEINNKIPFTKNKTAKELLEFEKENFLPMMPLYETASITEVRVSKYSTIMVDSSYYSVPDKYVDRLLCCKIYTGRILIFDGDKKIAEHKKLEGLNKWKIDISHYIYTLFRKPKALVNSTAFNQLDIFLKNTYKEYFEDREKEFIMLLNCIGKYGYNSVKDAIEYLESKSFRDITIDKIEFICNRDDENIIYLADYNDSIAKHSLNMLNEFNDLLI